MLIFFTYMWRFLECDPPTLSDVRPRSSTGSRMSPPSPRALSLHWPSLPCPPSSTPSPSRPCRHGQPTELAKRVKAPPTVLSHLQGLYTDTCVKGESVRSGTPIVLLPFHQATSKLIASAQRSCARLVMCAIALHIDSFVVRINDLADDFHDHVTRSVPRLPREGRGKKPGQEVGRGEWMDKSRHTQRLWETRSTRET